MRSGMSSVVPGIKLGAVNDYSQRRKEGLGAQVLKSDVPGSHLGPGSLSSV